MKIVEKNTPPPKRVECPYCHSLLEPETHDVCIAKTTCFGTHAYYCVCPECKQIVYLTPDPDKCFPDVDWDYWDHMYECKFK